MTSSRSEFVLDDDAQMFQRTAARGDVGNEVLGFSLREGDGPPWQIDQGQNSHFLKGG